MKESCKYCSSWSGHVRMECAIKGRKVPAYSCCADFSKKGEDK